MTTLTKKQRRDRPGPPPSFGYRLVGVPCSICDKWFTEDEWPQRHSDNEGEDIHAHCCKRSGPCSRAVA